MLNCILENIKYTLFLNIHGIVMKIDYNYTMEKSSINGCVLKNIMICLMVKMEV